MSLFASMQVSASGMSAQRTRAELLVENMANSETTRTPEGGPYRRKDVVFSTELQTLAVFRGISERDGHRRHGLRRGRRTRASRSSAICRGIPMRMRAATWRSRV